MQDCLFVGSAALDPSQATQVCLLGQLMHSEVAQSLRRIFRAEQRPGRDNLVRPPELPELLFFPFGSECALLREDQVSSVWVWRIHY
jgi:hypothetical protein